MPTLLLRPWLCVALLACGSLLGCGGGDSSPILLPDISGGRGPYSDLRPYMDASPYADVLVPCVRAETRDSSCLLRDLPILGSETENPSVAAVMERVVVSHNWMGRRFEEILAEMPADILLLLRATTAIVIDDDIRPSYYTSLTGAIYLDPAYLWRTPSELDTINDAPDHRSGYSDPLAFRSLSRYVSDGNDIYPYGLLDASAPRTQDDVVLLLSELMFHELAHANDFLPPSSWSTLNANQSIYEAIQANEDNFVSRKLLSEAPLTSDALYSLADVMYWGDAPTPADLAMDATAVGQAFEADGANDHYAYASIYEDTAMLFEEAMMKHHFDIDRDIAFTEVPPDPAYCRGYTIRWGVRNRLGDADVKARAQLVTGELLPSTETDLLMFFQDFPVPQFMRNGSNWCDTLNMDDGGRDYRTLGREPTLLPPRNLRGRH